MEWMLATTNAHKKEEFEQLFQTSKQKIILAPEKLDVDENGTSYMENAFLKASQYYKKFQCPTLADDSGLNVFSLPEELGIHSARFGGAGLTDRQRAELLLLKLEQLEQKKKEVISRDAYFVCVLCFYVNPDEIYYFEGRMDGEISQKYVGDNGFGYDPIFIPRLPAHLNGQFKAQIPVSELMEFKMQHSHRAQAVQHATRFFDRKVIAK